MIDRYTAPTIRPTTRKLIIFLSLLSALVSLQLITPPAIAQAGSDQIKFVYPECSQAMKDYFQLKYAIAIGSPVLCSLAIFGFLNSGLIAAAREKLKIKLSSPLSLAKFILLFYSLCFALKLPFYFYSGYMLEQQFKLSQQSIGSWLHGIFGLYLEGLILVPVLTLCLLLIRRFPKYWHLLIGLLLGCVIAGIAYLQPLVVDPYFNKFHDLPEGSLKKNIRILSLQSGLEHPQILVADKSKQTKKMNAYVNGIASSNRIVLFDNLVNDVPEKQILAVVAHELGHYRLNHLYTGLALAIAGLFPLLYIWKTATDKFLPKLPRRWGIKTNSDPVLLAVWCIVIWIAPLVISPIPAFVSRLLESEADAYAIRLSHDPLSAAEILRTLSQKNLSDPDPPAFIEFWFFSHPSIKHRIDYALEQLRERRESAQRSEE